MIDENKVQINEEPKQSTLIYIPCKLKSSLDCLAKISKQPKTETLKNALVLYSEWLQNKMFPSFGLMEAYLEQARKSNEMLRDEIFALKSQIRGLKECQADLIKAVSRLVAKK